MNIRILTLVATSLLVLPLGVNTAQANIQINDASELSSDGNLLAHGRGNRMGRGRGIEQLLQQLDLTPEQSEEIETIRSQLRSEESEALSQELQASQQEMRSLMAEDASGEQLRQQHQKLQSLRQQLSNNRFETMLQIREVLTPEQRLKMAELIEPRKGFRGER